MKKLILIALFIALGLMLVLGVNAENSNSNKSVNSANKTIAKNNSDDNESEHGNETGNRTRLNESNGIGQQLSAQIRELKGELKAGNYTGPLGQLLNVRQLSANLRELRVNNHSAETELNITQEQVNERTRLTVNLSNGKKKEIKVMPDTASQRALEALKLNACSPENNCTIVLKETGIGNSNDSVKYEVQIQRHARILGLFNTKISENAQVDAETGDVKVHRPWWAFLAVDAQ